MNISPEQYSEMLRRQKGGDAPCPSIVNRSRDCNAAPVQAARTGAQRMNRWEQEYAMELEARKRAGEILWYGFEAIKLRLTGATFYTPDFAVMELRGKVWSPEECRASNIPVLPGVSVIMKSPRPTFVEVKGHLRDDANVKFKVAAELFPWAEFFMYRKKKQSEGGGWELLKHLNGGGR